MSNLFNNAVQAVKLACANEDTLKAKLAEVETLAEATASTITVACTDAYAWFISLPKTQKHGAKKKLADAAGVSDKTVGRYIAGGYVEMVTDKKVEAGVACNLINNYKINLSDIEKVKSLSDWNKLVRACKAVLKNGAGNNGSGKGKTEPDTDNTDTDNTPDTDTEADSDTPFWVLCADKIAEEIASNEIDLMTVVDYITGIVADKKALATV